MQNDLIFISHYHEPKDGYVKLENESRQLDGDRASASSVLDRSATSPKGQKVQSAAFSEQVKPPQMQQDWLLIRLCPGIECVQESCFASCHQRGNEELFVQRDCLSAHAPSSRQWDHTSGNQAPRNLGKVSHMLVTLAFFLLSSIDLLLRSTDSLL